MTSPLGTTHQGLPQRSRRKHWIPICAKNVAGVFSIVALSDAALPEIRRCGLSYFPEWFSRWSGIPNPNLFLYLCSVSSSLSTTSLSLSLRQSGWLTGKPAYRQSMTCTRAVSVVRAHVVSRVPGVVSLFLAPGFCR